MPTNPFAPDFFGSVMGNARDNLSGFMEGLPAFQNTTTSLPEFTQPTTPLMFDFSGTNPFSIDLPSFGSPYGGGLGDMMASWMNNARQSGQAARQAAAQAQAAQQPAQQPAQAQAQPGAPAPSGGGAGYSPSGGSGAPGVEQWSALVTEAAQAYNLPESTIKGLMEIESGGDPNAVSSANAQGLMQVMPFHFGPGENPRDPRTNIMKGAKVYADALARFGDPDKAAAAYFGAIDGAGNITHATDGSSVDGFEYVRRWRAAAAKYQAQPSQSVQPAPAPQQGQPAAQAPQQFHVRNKRTGLVSPMDSVTWQQVTNPGEFDVVP
jgi:hypothetical protein